MKNFQTVVQELLHNHERQRRYIALLTALCMLMAFTVSIILIEPAESMTGELACGMSEHIHNENCFTYTCGLEDDENHIHSADCRTLTCGKTEHAHSENCYIHEDEQTAQIMQINSPQFIDNGTPEGDLPSGDENISPQNGDVQVMDSGDEEDEYFKEVQKTKPESAVPFPEISDIIIDVNGKQYKPNDTITATLDKLENVSFDIKYILQNNSVSVDQPYICYKLPDGIILPPNLCGAGRYVTDPAYSGPAGYYSISEDGLIVIRFTKAYIQTKLSTASGDVEGHIKFNGTIERNNTSDGDRDLQFEDKTIHVEFPNKDGYFTSKSGKIIRPTDVNGDIKIEWAVKVNSFDNTSFANGVVTDSKFAAVTDKSSITIDPPNNDNSLGEWSGDEFHFSSGVSNSVNQVTFKYEETISKEDFANEYGKDFDYEVPNEAKLNVGGEDYPADSTVRFDEKPSINKSAKNDYENNKGFNGEIYWTVVVEHPYGVSLKDYSVQDNAFMNEKALGLTLKDEHGSTLNSPDDYTIDSETGTIKFIKDVSRVTITYRTKVEDLQGKESVEVPNNARLIAPDIYDNDNKEIGNSEVKKSYEQLQKLSDKTGEYLPDSGEIAWTVGAETKQNSGIDLDGYTITDAAFANWDFTMLNRSDISATLFGKGWDEHVNDEYANNDANIKSITATEIEFVNGEKLVLDKATNTITVVGKIKKFSLTYKTKVDDADEKGSKGTKRITGEDGEISVENTVSDKWGNSKTGKAPIVSRDKTEKKLLNKTERHFAKTGESNSIKQELQWQIDLTKDAGFSGDDLEDNVTATVSGGDGVTVTHYIDLSSIEVYYSTDGSNYTEKLNSELYTVTPSSGNDVTEFTISFDEQVKSEGYHYIRVTYKSIVTMTPPDGGWKFDETTGKIIFTFDNTANGKTVDGNITVQDENHVDKTKIKVAKKWRDNDTESTTPPAGIDKVEFYIQRRSANTNTWETYKNDGTWGNDEDPKIYTLDSSNNWQETIENLPVETADHNNLYYYHAVEVNIPEGYHVVSSTQDETGVNSESEPFIITNEKDPTIKKEAFDKDGNVIADGSKISTDKLAHLTYNGADCYEIPYKITLENYSGVITFTDIIPDDFQLAHNQSTGWDNAPDYQPRYYLNQGDTSKNPFLWVDDSLHGHYILRDSKLSLNINTDSYKIITYNIVIPVSELNGLLGSDGKLVENSISGGSASASTEFTITAGTETPDSPEENLLEKSVDNGTVDGKFTAYNGEIMYSVYANPTGKDIANGDDYDIHDILRLTGLESNSNPQEVMAQLLAGNLKITVQEVANYSEDESGRITADVVRTLIPGEYSYNVDYLPSKTKIEYPEVNYDFGNWDNWTGGFWQTYSAKFGDKVTLIFHGKVGEKLETTFNNGSSEIAVNEVYDENGCIKVSFTVAATDGHIYGNIPKEKLKSIEAEVIREEVTTTIDSSADLAITVPDGMPLKITYSYTLKKPDGSYLTTNADEVRQFTASNEVSLNTNNASSHDSKTADFDYRYDDSATVSTGNMPKIVKYNVGNQGESLPAKFYIVQYNGSDGKWYFSSDNDPKTEDKNGIKTRTYNFNFSIAVDSDKSNQIPNGAAAIELDVDTINENLLTLDPGKLYKIIEVKVPNGDSNNPNADSYEANDKYIRDLVSGSDDGINSLEDLLKKYFSGEECSAYSSILNKFISVRYFRYTDADVENPPSGYDSLNVTTVPKNGTLGIPNNELIDITAIKTWDNDVSNKGAVEFTLYWSYTKSNNGIPNDATKATASDLGLTASAFENPKTVAVSGTEQSCTWTNLPNGKFNGTVDRPIYYYIKETKYTVNSETYKLNETDNKFYKLESENSDKFVEPRSEGAYQQFYTNNGINKSGEITVKNTKGLYVKKVWRTADNKALAADDIPVEHIKYVITGVGADGKRINIYEGTLTKDNNWTEAVPANKLEGYTDFKVKEEIEEGQVEILHGFNFSPNYNVTGSIGEITLVNKNNNPSVIDVTVNKEWSDGAENHTENSIKVWLYRTSRYLTSEELETLKNTGTLSAEGLSCERVTIDDVNEWTLNSANGWTETWEYLPYKGEIDSNKVSRFYYYAVEKTVIGDYKATYSRNDQSSLQTLTIRNAIPGSLTLQKSWHDTSGNSIEAPAGTDSIEVSLYRREKKHSSGDTSKLPTNQIKIMALGDSITDGYTHSTDGYRKYFYDVLVNTYHMNIDMVGSKGGTWDNSLTSTHLLDGRELKYDSAHEGHSGFSIESYGNRTGLEETIIGSQTVKNNNPDIVLLLIGTNDIMDNHEINNIETRLKNLVDEVYSQKSDVTVFIMSPPPISSKKALASGYTSSQNETNQTLMDSNVSACITAVQNVVKYEKENLSRNCIYLDLNAKFVNYKGGYEEILHDYCHPNETGYELMGNFLAEEIVKYYGGSITTSVPENVNGVPFDIKNGEYEFVNKYTIEKSKDWTLSIPDLSTKNNGNDYVYYIVEETTGNWTAAYDGNGQILGNEGATITVTNTIDKGSIDVEKKWENSNGTPLDPSLMQSIEVQLYRSTTKPESELKTSSIMNESMALADDGIMLTSFEGNVLTIGEPDEKSGNILKYLMPVGDYSSGWVNIKISDSMKNKKVSGIEFPNGTNFSNVSGWDNGKLIYSYSPAKTLQELFNAYDAGFSGNITENSYLIITLAEEESEGGDTGGGDSGDGGGGETDNPTQPQGGKSLDLQQAKKEDGSIIENNKKAVISNTSTLKSGDTITVNLKCTGDISGIKGCFGFNPNDGGKWINNEWNTDEAENTTFSTSGDTVTIIWTIPENCNVNYIEFQIWWQADNVESATYTVTSGGTEEPEPSEPVDPEPTDSHIPTGAELLETITLKSANGWKHTFENLPLTDASGNPYYYYVKEVNVPEGFEVTYSDGVTPDGKITITNTKKESSTTTMPSTGGNGARKYYTVGGMLLMLSACGWAMHHRKRVIPH